MKKRIFITAAAVVLCITALMFSGCTKLYGNDRSNAQYFEFAQTGEAYYFKTAENLLRAEYLCLDKQTGEYSVKTYSLENGESFGDVPYSPYVPSTEQEYFEYDGQYYTVPDAPTVLCGNTFPRYGTAVTENYIPLLTIINEQYLNGDARLIQYYATEKDGSVYGFVNAYYKSMGMLFAAGQIGVEEIAYTSFFSYNLQTKQLTELARLEGCNTVGYTSQKIFYFKNRKYYCCNYSGNGEKYICDDVAFDSGATSYSYASFYFNEDCIVLYMNRRPGNSKGDLNNIVVCTAEGKIALNYTDYNP